MSIVSFCFGIVLGLAVGIAIAIPATSFFFKEMVRWSLKYAARYKAALDIMCEQYEIALIASTRILAYYFQRTEKMTRAYVERL